MGGYSNEYEISIRSGQVVYETLKDTFNCFRIYIRKNEWILKKDNDFYKIDIDKEKKVIIEMTLTSPNCPVAESQPNSVKDNILKLDGVKDVDLKLVWDPPWTKEKMSEAAKLELNL